MYMHHLPLAVFFIFCTGCTKPPQNSETETPTEAQASASFESKWEYRATKNPMTDQVLRYASIISKDNIPANDSNSASPATINIHDIGSIYISSAQIFECYSDECNISIRFGSEPARSIKARNLNLSPPTLSLRGSSSDSNNPKNLEHDELISKIKQGGNFMIQLPILNNGLQVVNFDLSGYDEKQLKATAPRP